MNLFLSSSLYLSYDRVWRTQSEIGFRYSNSRRRNITVQTADFMVADTVEHRWSMPGLMTAGAGQTKNEVTVVGHPCRLNHAKAVLVVFGRIVQGTLQLIIGRIELESAFMAYIGWLSGPFEDRENHNVVAIFGPVFLWLLCVWAERH